MAEATQLKQKAQEARERQKKLEGLLSDAQRRLKAGQFEACLELAAQGLALEADHPLFKELSVEAQRQFELRRQIAEGLKHAAQHLEKREYQAAIEAYDSVLKLVPGPSRSGRGSLASPGSAAAPTAPSRVSGSCQAALEAKDFEGCQKAAQEGLRLEPAHPMLQGLAKQAAEIIERIRRVQQLWDEASQSRQKGELPSCLALARFVAGIGSGRTPRHGSCAPRSSKPSRGSDAWWGCWPRPLLSKSLAIWKHASDWLNKLFKSILSTPRRSSSTKESRSH
jgi:hypothetical protein